MPDEYEEVEIYQDEDGNYTDADGNAVDEEGNPLPVAAAEQRAPMPATESPAVGEAPVAAGEPKPVGKAAKLVIAGAAAAVLIVGGGIAFGLSQVGNQNTVQDVKDVAAAKSSEARAAVSSKSAEVAGPADACSDLSRAAWSGSTAPSMRLKITDSAPLPSGFVDRMKGPSVEVVTLQTAKDAWGLYVAEPKPAKGAAPSAPWWKTSVDSTKGLRVSEGPGDGTDENVAGACKQGQSGPYAVVGDVPAAAKGLKDGQATVTAVQADGGSENEVLAVIGDRVVTATIEAVPADDGKEK